MTSAGPDRSPKQELRSKLRQLRERAGLTTRELAALTRGELSQSKVSRMENPDHPAQVGPASRDDVVRVLTALGDVVPDDEREDVLKLVAEAHEEHESRVTVSTTRVLLREGFANLQRQWRRHEKSAKRVGVFHPAIVPGLAQTDGYLREVFGPGVETPSGREWVSERLGRQEDREGLPATLLMTEGTLTQPVADAEVGARQCEHLAELARRRGGGWRVGVIPAVLKSGQTYHHPPQNGFDLYDDEVVVFGTTAGVAVVDRDSRTVQRHVELFRRLEALAAFGEDAAAVFERAAARYRALAN